MLLTISALKADVGSIGGHTRPSKAMITAVRDKLDEAKDVNVLCDFNVTHTGDDICLLMIHRYGKNHQRIHHLAWNVFMAATRVAQEQALYGAGQDLLVNAPSHNLRGAGPGVAEIEFDETAKERPVEPFLVFTADKCGPGAFNFPLGSVFTNPMYCAGLMLPGMREGFRFHIIDMDHAGADRIIELDSPERLYDIAILLRDEHRFGIDAIYSRAYPHQQVAAVSAMRLHTVAGKYTGKDDPVAIVRTQRTFPAPEEVVMPFTTAHFVGGDARGSHNMPLMPVAINSTVAGPYCLPIVACLAYSITKDGKLSEAVDLFGDRAWDATRLKAQQKADDIRRQGFFGPAMLPTSELEYGAYRDVLKELDGQFKLCE